MTRDRYFTSGTGPSLRDTLAMHETLADYDAPDGVPLKVAVAEKLAGRPMPASDCTVEWHRWHADWRAALRYLRADAMLAARDFCFRESSGSEVAPAPANVIAFPSPHQGV